jgi:tetratricopeptide (TPR) repeat protein
MARGKTAAEAKKWEDAVKAYDEALLNKPGDEAAIAAKKAAVAELKSIEDAKKKEAAYVAAMKEGKAAADAKKWAEAVKAYDAALAAKPRDVAATAGRKAAQAEVDLIEGAKKKEAAYLAAMKEARAAADAKKWAEAVRAYDAALKNRPNDKAALEGRKIAQAGLDKIEDAKKKEAAYQAAMKQAKAAFDAKKYADAAKLYDAALAQKPNDQAALAGKKAAEDAQKPKKPDPNEEDYRLAMGAGADAMKKGNYQGAVNSYRHALVKKPKDPDATKALAEAERLLKADTDKKKEAAYQAAMTKARAAFAAKKFADAVKLYDEALQNKPGDKAAIDGKKASIDAQKPQPKPDAKAELAKEMQQGLNLEKQKKYFDAVNAYTRAVKWAADLGGKAELARAWLGVARNEHAQKNFAEAVKAYEEVLKRDPTNAEAKAGLPKAKANKQ